MLRRVCLVATVMVACDGEVAPADVDAPPVDAAPPPNDGVLEPDAIDAPPAPVPNCTVSPQPTPSPGGSPPAAGTYCVEWTRVDGVQDPFARYFDRVDIALAPGHARWWTTGSGGLKEYEAGGGQMGGCFYADPFVTPDGYSGSNRVPLCWHSPTQASGAMAWCSGSLSEAHWTLTLTLCP